MKNVSRIVVLSAAAALFSVSAYAQDAAAPAAAPAAGADCEAAKTDPNLYPKWLENRTGDAAKQKTAYDAGKEFLAKCPGVEDAYVTAVKKWVAKYDEAVGKFAVRQRFEDAAKAVDAAPAGSKNYAPLFVAGKEYVAAEPENLNTLLVLTNVGYANALAGEAYNKSLDADAISFARRALALVESGKATPEQLKLLGAANKDEAVIGLNYRLGVITRGSAPDEAISYLLKVAQSSSPLKSDPSLYFFLAQAYAPEYKRLADDYNARFAGKEETDESRMAQAKLTASLNRILDAYARAVAFNTKTDADSVKFKNNTTATLTSLYKQSHNDSDAGLAQFISESATRRLPLPTDPVPTPAPVAAPATTNTTPATGTGTTGGTGTATTGTPAAKPKP